ncbi:MULTISPECIES: CsbD family protein [Cupriavidus]
MNESQVKGRLEKAKGKLREMFGKTTGRKTTELRGKAEQLVGEVQASYGDAKEQQHKQS